MRPNVSKQPTWRRLAQAVAKAPPDAKFTDLVKIAELDPARDFVCADLSGVSFAACNLTGYDFTAARLHGCDFTDAIVLGATFRMAELDRVMHGANPDQHGPAVLRGNKLFGRTTDLNSAARLVETLFRWEEKPWRGPRKIPDWRFAGLAEFKSHLPAGAIFQDAPFAPEMVVVPSGTYLRGDEREPEDGVQRRRVSISHRLAVGRYAVTFEEWDACVTDIGTKYKPDDEKWGRVRRPVINVSWDDITKNYLPWLNKRLGLSGAHAYRLLTEAEWEYCCRAGTETAYSFGDTITKSQAQFSEGQYGSAKETVEVGTFPSNAWGLHDMHGNVWEWCQDIFHDNYKDSPEDGAARENARTSKDKTVSRVLRGGCWFNGPQSLASAFRIGFPSNGRDDDLGFRLARTLHP